MKKRTCCKVKGCFLEAKIKQLCSPHYQQMRRYGKITNNKIRGYKQNNWSLRGETFKQSTS